MSETRTAQEFMSTNRLLLFAEQTTTMRVVSMDDATLDLGKCYDKTPYPSAPYPQTHPDHLAVIGTLFGMQPRPVDGCRVLELGCADGSNLIPMAANYPDSEFVGIDLSERQISSAKQLADRLRLSNICFRQQSILDRDDSLCQFDYIIAHGVFSWVPFQVQQGILQLCRQRLAPQGIAYVSYNTNPGWRLRGMLRDMMIYHTRSLDDSSTRVQQARALVEFLAAEVRGQKNAYGVLLGNELEEMREWEDEYFRHDSLAEINEPLYFHQFIERATEHGLRYLGESEFHTMFVDNLSPQASRTLQHVVAGPPVSSATGSFPKHPALSRHDTTSRAGCAGWHASSTVASAGRQPRLPGLGARAC